MLQAVIGGIVVLSLSAPMWFTNRSFGPDFTNNIWLGAVRADQLGTHFGYSYFVSSRATGVLDPLFVFYAGTLYTILGLVDRTLGGHIILAFELMTTGALAASYWGLYGCARVCGASRRLSHLPAVAFLSGSYYLTDLYARGDWVEFMTVSSIAPALAAGSRILRSERVASAHVMVLFGSLIVLTGGHTVVLAWAVVLVAFTFGAFYMSGWRPPLSLGRIVLVGTTAISAVLVNAWAIVPELNYAARTSIASQARSGGARFFDSLGTILSPVPFVPKQSTTPGLFVQLPSLMLAASIVALALAWPSASLKLRRSAGILLVLISGIVALVVTGVWTYFPRPLSLLQFGYRLESFASLGVAALVVTAACARCDWARGIDGLAKAVLVCASGVCLAIGIWQVWSYRVGRCASRSCAVSSLTVAPLSWYAGADYADLTGPVVDVRRHRAIDLQPASVRYFGDGLAVRLDPPTGRLPILTNIVYDPAILEISGGLKVVGRSVSGMTVVTRMAQGSKPVTLRLDVARSTGVVFGRDLSMSGLVLALVGALSLALRLPARYLRRVRTRTRLSRG